MLWLYNLGLVAALLLGAPIWALWVLLSSRARSGFFERWKPLARNNRPTIWIHAASMGEAAAAMPLLEALRRRGQALLATTTTTRGRDLLRQRFPGLTVRLIPLDLPGLVQVSLSRARIRALVLIETELWPNWIRAARRAGAPVVIVSGRISDRSFRRYRWARFFFAPLLRDVERLAARSEEDRRRFVSLGLPAERSEVCGDLKLDREPAATPNPALKQSLGEGPFLIGGSTHAGEEEALLTVWRELRASEAPELRLMLVPRHLERVADVCATVRRFGARLGLRSEGAADAEVIVVDSVGELASLYGLADLVFSGGTLAQVGGHNLVEPVQAGRVVVHGPFTQNQRPQERLLEPFGVLHRVRNARELADTLRRLWRDPQRHAAAEAAQEGLLAHRGAAGRALQTVLDVLGESA